MPDEQSPEPGSKIHTEQLLRQMNDEWVKALVRGDAESSGDVRVEFISRENTSVRIWDSTAVLTGKDSAKWYYKGRDFSGHYKIIHVYAHRGDRWQLVSVQACPIP